MAELTTYGNSTAHTYAQAGFCAGVRRGTRPAAALVDLTRGFAEPDLPSGAGPTPTVRSTARPVEAAHAVTPL